MEEISDKSAGVGGTKRTLDILLRYCIFPIIGSSCPQRLQVPKNLNKV